MLSCNRINFVLDMQVHNGPAQIEPCLYDQGSPHN
jgi:hypothetical protein